MLYIRYCLATSRDTLFSVIGIIISIAALLIISSNKNKSLRIYICAIAFLLIVLLGINSCAMQNYIAMPNVETRSLEFARNKLLDAGFSSDRIISLAQDGSNISNTSAPVESQNIPCGQPVLKDTLIELRCGSVPVSTNTDSTAITITHTQNSAVKNDLSLIIDDCNFFSDGYYYEFPLDGDAVGFIEYDTGIAGHFSYSRALTDAELEDWMHGGEILDSNGRKCDLDASFFSVSDGVFAAELPENMHPGNYTYVLYQFIDSIYYEARISFTAQ